MEYGVHEIMRKNVIFMKKEIWKDVSGYEGLYKVSNLGRIKSMPREWITGSRGSIRTKEETINRAANVHGYFRIWLSKDGQAKQFGVHRIVAIAFMPNPSNKPQVNHIDGNKQNNKAENLEWATSKENVIHSHKTGLHNQVFGENHGKSTLTNELVLKIRELGGKYTQQQIADRFKVGRRNVSNILNRKLWSHI